MPELIPALLVHDQKTFEHRLRLVEGLTDWVQVDIEDGSFVPGRTWFDTVSLVEEDFTFKYWLHLMIDDPVGYMSDFPKGELRHLIGATAHIEPLTKDGFKTFYDMVKSLGIKVGAASAEGFSKFDWDDFDFDEVLVLGVKPGKSGQELLEDTFERIELAKNINNGVLAFDGGTREDNISSLLESGIDRVYASSMIYDTQDPGDTYAKVKEKYDI